MAERQAPGIDGLDLLLIEQLERDGRQSVASLAKTLDLSWSTVQDMIKRLEQERIIRFLTLVDPPAIGYTGQVLVGINTPPSQIDAVAKKLADVREIYHISIHTGRYDMLASVSLPQTADLWQFVNSGLAPITDISRAEVMVVLKTAKFSLSMLANRSILRSDRERPKQGLDDLDYRLMRELRAHPRASYPSLATSAGCSKATARRRLNKLMHDQVVQVIAVADPVRLGYCVRATTGLKVQPGMISQVATALASSPYTHHIIITTGSFDLLFTTFFKTHDDLSSFVGDFLGIIPGVISHEVMVLMKVAKDTFGADWGFTTQL